MQVQIDQLAEGIQRERDDFRGGDWRLRQHKPHPERPHFQHNIGKTTGARYRRRYKEFHAYRENAFDTFCRAVIRNESIDAHRELAARARREVSISFPTPEVLPALGTEDTYQLYRKTFYVGQHAVHACNAVQALNDFLLRKNVPLWLQKPVAELLDAANTGTVTAQKWIAELKRQLYDPKTYSDPVKSNLRAFQADALALLRNLPAALSSKRRAAVRHILSLGGKVNDFWGGKSWVPGWDGQLQLIRAEDSETTGTYRPFGLDCSGLVDWVLYNASDGEYLIRHGGGAYSQHTYCTDISWAEAQPGDLVFYPGDSHVGIVGSWDEKGELLASHCGSGANSVVIEEVGKAGFEVIARPLYYGDAISG